MELKLHQERLEERMRDSPKLLLRDRAIVKIANTHGYDYDRAARMYEVLQVK